LVHLATPFGAIEITAFQLKCHIRAFEAEHGNDREQQDG